MMLKVLEWARKFSMGVGGGQEKNPIFRKYTPPPRVLSGLSPMGHKTI